METRITAQVPADAEHMGFELTLAGPARSGCATSLHFSVVPAASCEYPRQPSGAAGSGPATPLGGCQIS